MKRTELVRTRSLQDCCRDKIARERGVIGERVSAHVLVPVAVPEKAPTKPRAQLKKTGEKKRLKAPRERAFKISIRARDKWTCQKCGREANEVHHAFTVGAHPELEFEAWNCLTLCVWCHRMGNEAAHNDMTGFRRSVADRCPRFARWYDRKYDIPRKAPLDGGK